MSNKVFVNFTGLKGLKSHKWFVENGAGLIRLAGISIFFGHFNRCVGVWSATAKKALCKSSVLDEDPYVRIPSIIL